jgi:acyl carrier protein
MDANLVKELVKKILIESLSLQISPDKIKGEDLINEFGINSVDAISIFISIENTFDIFIEDEDLSAALISSLESITNYIIGKKTIGDDT